MPQVWWNEYGHRVESWGPGEWEAFTHQRTLEIKADRLELEAQARERHNAALRWTQADALLRALVKLHAPEPDTYEMVACTGCPDCYGGRPRWPCETFSLIERHAVR